MEDAGGLNRLMHVIIYLTSLSIYSLPWTLQLLFFPITVLWLYNQFLYFPLFPYRHKCAPFPISFHKHSWKFRQTGRGFLSVPGPSLCNDRGVKSLACRCMRANCWVGCPPSSQDTNRKWVWTRQLHLALCGSPRPAAGSLLRFAEIVGELAQAFFLLLQGVQHDAHGRPLQADPLHLILQLVLEVAKPERGMDEHHCGEGRHGDTWAASLPPTAHALLPSVPPSLAGVHRFSNPSKPSHATRTAQKPQRAFSSHAKKGTAFSRKDAAQQPHSAHLHHAATFQLLLQSRHSKPPTCSSHSRARLAQRVQRN